MFLCWPFVRPICSRVNGAPYNVGDRVVILSGPQKGQTGDVCKIIRGQGGWNLAVLNSGDIFEEYALLKINSNHDHHSTTAAH